MKGTIVRINRYGLCEVRVNDREKGPRRTGFTLDQLAGYRGQPVKAFGIRVGVDVDIQEDNEGRVKSARLLGTGALAHS